MLYHAGNSTVALTSVSPTMKSRTKGKDMQKGKGVLPVRVLALVWQCPVCQTYMPLNDSSKRPKRCSNRRVCGVMFAKE